MKKVAAALALVLLLPLAALADEIPELGNTGLQAMIDKNKGKVVMINFFATWCPPCRVELPELVKLRDAFPKDKFTLIGLALDETRDPVGPFIKLVGINYPVYMANSTITDAYNINSVPFTVFINQQGQVDQAVAGIVNQEELRQAVQDLINKK